MLMAKVHVFSFYEKLKLNCYAYLFLSISAAQATTKGMVYTPDTLTEQKALPLSDT